MYGQTKEIVKEKGWTKKGGETNGEGKKIHIMVLYFNGNNFITSSNQHVHNNFQKHTSKVSLEQEWRPSFFGRGQWGPSVLPFTEWSGVRASKTNITTPDINQRGSNSSCAISLPLASPGKQCRKYAYTSTVNVHSKYLIVNFPIVTTWNLGYSNENIHNYCKSQYHI